MKELFPGFYPSKSREIDLNIEGTVVVFDANVLLNLYRYPSSASEDLLQLMEGLADKVWLPYQAALEYQRNRLSVIAEQKRRFREVRATVEKGISSLEVDLGKLQLVKRHSTIDATKLLYDLHAAEQKFLKTLSEQEDAQRDVTDEDPIRDRLDTIFANRVGEPPPNEDSIREIEKEGKARYESKTPPGYRDQAKEGETFTHQGFLYRQEFGDLILWKQVMGHARQKNIKQLIFVTDDDKEDWWFITDSAGLKRIGPRPELTEELKRASGVDRFLMLSSERFAPLFAEILKLRLRAKTIEQVEDVKSTLSEPVAVTCPTCHEGATIRLGMYQGSSAIHFCSRCKSRFHIHRGGEGNVFTREWGSSGSIPTTHRVEAICPKCREYVPANIRDDQESTRRYCMNCCTLLEINSSGGVVSSQPSSPVVAASTVLREGYTYLTCPECAGGPPIRTIWGNDQIVRAVCPSCQRLIEGKREKPVE